MRLGIAGLAALGIVTFVTTSAFADPPHEGRGFHPHISVQIAPPVVNPGYGPGYVAPQPAYPVYGGGPAYGGGPGGERWQDPGFFAARVDQQMRGIEIDLRDRVQRGEVSPRAMGELADREQDIRGDVRAAGRDGVITPDERQHIHEDVDSLRFLEQRYHTNYGGGPGYGTPGFGGWHSNW